MSTLPQVENEQSFHRFTYEGFPVHMKEYARGRTEVPLVFIGGAFQNISRVEKLSNAIAEKSWVITVDTPGNGDTGVLPYSYGFDFICRAIHQGLKELGIDRVNLLGCSYGTIVALRYAQNFLGVDRLMLAAAMDKIPPSLEYDFNLLLFQLEWNRLQDFADGFTNLMTNPDLRKTNRLCRVAAEKLHHALLHSSEGIREQFKQNTLRILKDGTTDLSVMPDVDTTVFAGEMDHFVPVEANKKIASAFKRGRFIEIPDADHMIHVEKFRTMIGIIHDALARNCTASERNSCIAA